MHCSRTKLRLFQLITGSNFFSEADADLTPDSDSVKESNDSNHITVENMLSLKTKFDENEENEKRLWSITFRSYWHHIWSEQAEVLKKIAVGKKTHQDHLHDEVITLGDFQNFYLL